MGRGPVQGRQKNRPSTKNQENGVLPLYASFPPVLGEEKLQLQLRRGA